MFTTLGVVQVRLRGDDHQWADRPESLAGRKLGGNSLLEWVVRRVTDCQRLDGVIVVVADRPEDRRIAEFVPPNVPVFIGSQPDPLGRIAAAVRKFPAKAVVRVCIDNPFVDPVQIDRLIIRAERFANCDYTSYCSRDGRPAVASNLGVFAEWCRTEALLRADREAVHAADRQDVTRYVYSHADLFRLNLIPVPPQLDRDDVRLKINVEEDWEHAQVIYEALGPECLDWQRIVGLLDHQPALRERMATLNRAETSGRDNALGVL